MISDSQLMEQLLKAAARTRRQPPRPSPDGGMPPPHGLGRGRILRAIRDAGSPTQTELANALNIRPQSLSEALSKLETDGLISRTRSQVDKRRTVVCLTKAGMDDMEEHRIKREGFIAEYFSPLSDSEKETLYALLSRLTEGSEDK